MTEPLPGDDGRVLRAIEKLDDRLRAFQELMATQFANLPQQFMPRDQLGDRLEDIRGRASEQAADIVQTNARIEAAEVRRTTDRRFFLTTSLTALLVAFAAIAIVVSIHLH